MFWKSPAPHNTDRHGLASLRAPLALEIETRLRDELQRCLHQANWTGLKIVLRELEDKRTSLGNASVAAIVNFRHAPIDPSPLHLVCGRDESCELARRLLALGADPNAKARVVSMRNYVPSDDRPTPLFCAIASGDLKLTKLLLKHNASVTELNSLGETPLLFAIRAQPMWSRERAAFQKALLFAGASPTTSDVQGITPLAELVLHEWWDEAAYLAKKVPNKRLVNDRAKDKIVAKLIQSGLSALARVEDRNPELRAFLKNLDTLHIALGANVVSAVLNSPISGGPSLFARMIDFEVKSYDIVTAEQLGGSLTRTFESRFGSMTVKDATAFHHVVATNNPGLIGWALAKVGRWFVQQPVGEQRLSPLHLLYTRNKRVNLEAARLLIEAGVDPRATTKSGANLFEMAVSAEDTTGMDLWAEYLTNPYVDASPLVRDMALHDEAIQTYKRQFSEFGRMRVGLPSAVEREMKAWAGNEDAREFTKRCREYVEAYYVAKQPDRWIRNHSEMYKLIPRAMLAMSPLALVNIIKAIDTLNDHDERARGWHPFQAELMALLAHPGQSSPTANDVDVNQDQISGASTAQMELRRAVTLALTSIHRFNNLNIYKVPPAAVHFWGRVGVGSFSFRYQKWDARGVALVENRARSLLEMYGFEPLERDLDFAYDLGVGFELSQERKERIQRTLSSLGIKFDPNVRIQYYQGCKRAFIPGVGDFILRNSSPFFGPHLLKHPAYFSRFTAHEGLPAADATELTSTTIEQSFMPALQSTLYVPGSSALFEMEYLLGHIEEVDNDLNAWKFDTGHTTAWDKIEGVGTVLRGGYFSDGFPDVVQHLSRLSVAAIAVGEPPPHLAFFPRNLPAWRPIPFTDLDGKEYSTLEITPETLELLRKLQSSSADKNDYRNDNGRVYHFFQMGLDQGATLAIVDGKEVSHDM